MDLLINPIKQRFQVIRGKAVGGKPTIKSHRPIICPKTNCFEMFISSVINEFAKVLMNKKSTQDGPACVPPRRFTKPKSA